MVSLTWLQDMAKKHYERMVAWIADFEEYLKEYEWSHGSSDLRMATESLIYTGERKQQQAL